MDEKKDKSHLLFDFLVGCNSFALSSSTTAVLVVLREDLLVLAGSVTVSSRTEVSALVFLGFFLVALVVLSGSARVSSRTELSARARLRVALVDLAGWETVWSAWFSSSSSFFLPRPFLPLVLPGV